MIVDKTRFHVETADEIAVINRYVFNFPADLATSRSEIDLTWTPDALVQRRNAFDSIDTRASVLNMCRFRVVVGYARRPASKLRACGGEPVDFVFRVRTRCACRWLVWWPLLRFLMRRRRQHVNKTDEMRGASLFLRVRLLDKEISGRSFVPRGRRSRLRTVSLSLRAFCVFVHPSRFPFPFVCVHERVS